MPEAPKQCKYCDSIATIGDICDGDHCRVQEEIVVGVVARFECANMADDSFQQWLDEHFPDLHPELRAEFVEHYRSGTLRC